MKKLTVPALLEIAVAVVVIVCSFWAARHWWNEAMVTLHLALGSGLWIFCRVAYRLIEVGRDILHEFDEFRQWRESMQRQREAESRERARSAAAGKN